VKLGLDRFSKEIFEQYGNATVADFFASPRKEYLIALEKYYFFSEQDNSLYPYIKKMYNPLELISKKRKYAWRRGCIHYTFPDWLLNILRS
jgi:uncharacterized pyridoxamine 5'-phosphate oxidase family protein